MSATLDICPFTISLCLIHFHIHVILGGLFIFYLFFLSIVNFLFSGEIVLKIWINIWNYSSACVNSNKQLNARKMKLISLVQEYNY